jgi:hypothetical protein
MCIPTSDAIGGSIVEGVDEILNTTRGKRSHFQGLYIRLIGESAPVVVAFTKSDLAFPHISGSESGNYQNQDRTRTRAYAHCEQLCRSLFRREAMDVPAELVSGDYSHSPHSLRNVPRTSSFVFVVMPQYGALINNLIVTTDRFIMRSRTAPSSRSSSQGAKPRIAPTPLAWSVALRASRDITIQASIEYVVYLSTLIPLICFGSQDWTEP